MAHIVTNKCQRCRFTHCVEVCPVACFHGDEERLYIDADTCIDCSACIEVCPVRAIYDQYDMPEEYQTCIAINSKALDFPVIDTKHEPLPTAMERKKELGY
jgi:ferredoxin